MSEVVIKFIALSIIFLDVLILWKNKKNSILLLMNFLFFYFDYSILQGQYLAENIKITNNNIESNFYYLYERELIIFLLFVLIRFVIFMKYLPPITIPKKENSKLFTLCIFIIVYIGIFFFDRTYSSGYEVKTTPVFEYSIVFFILANYFCPPKIFYKFFLYFVTLLFIFQDLYFGGRITSLQVILITVLFNFQKILTLKRFVLPFFLFNFLFTLVGVIRSSSNYEIQNIFQTLSQKLFVLDTAVYSYFASTTQLLAADSISFNLRLESLVSFIFSIIFGSSLQNSTIVDYKLSLVSEFSSSFHWNAGGGLIFSYYYFWLGFAGVIILTFLMLKIIKTLMFAKNNIWILLLICIVATLPRWYLYTPLIFYRLCLFIFPIVCFSFFWLGRTFIKNK